MIGGSGGVGGRIGVRDGGFRCGVGGSGGVGGRIGVGGGGEG